MVFLVKNMCSFPNPHGTGYVKHEIYMCRTCPSSGRQTISHQTRWNKYLGIWNIYLFMKRVCLKAMRITEIKFVALRARKSFCPALAKDGVKMATTIQHKYGMPRIASDTPKSASGSFCFRWYGFTMGSFRLSQGTRHSICLIGSDQKFPDLGHNLQNQTIQPIGSHLWWCSIWRTKARKSPKSQVVKSGDPSFKPSGRAQAIPRPSLNVKNAFLISSSIAQADDGLGELVGRGTNFGAIPVGSLAESTPRCKDHIGVAFQSLQERVVPLKDKHATCANLPIFDLQTTLGPLPHNGSISSGGIPNPGWIAKRKTHI